MNTPKDKIIFDVGHQAYAHKILTGRNDNFSTLRQYRGLSGFPSKDESVYDPFTSGHSSNAVSLGLGLACARDFLPKEEKLTGSLFIDISKIRNLLGWRLPFTLEEGIRETVKGI